MVASIGPINPTNVEATAYISAVAAFAAVVLVVLLFLGRRWCHGAVFARKGCHGVLTVNAGPDAPCLTLDNAHDTLSKPIHYPDRIFAFEPSDDDEEQRLRIQQDKEEVGCHYEEKNENAAPIKAGVEVELVETALRESTLRETRIDDVVPRRAEYIHTLEAQSSVDSDVIVHNDTSLLCGESSSQERGSVELTLLYDAPVRSMTVHVLQARALPQRTPQPLLQSQVRIVLLPLKRQKFKSKIRNGENPQYMESFVLHKINPEDVYGLGLRIRIYGCERMRRQRLLGEAAVSFATLNLELENSLWLQLAPRQQPSLQLPKLELNHSMSMSGVLASPSSITTTTPTGGGESCSLARSDSASSCCSARSAPELLLGLQYSSITGHLSVEVIKGTHFRKLSPNKAPDTYVKLSLISSLGMEMGRCKSTTRRAQSNPLYKELFIFQVALFQLTEVTLMVSVWWRRSVKRNEMVGWFSLGHSPSGRDEERHWQELCEGHGEQVQRWHVLLES
ncbi:synaptotagmin-16 [Cydia splendana]|uniref:synaptotagmin-16 n=1 Tax=Cydia splendana TaxID=1100963 RepID=UPI0021448980